MSAQQTNITVSGANFVISVNDSMFDRVRSEYKKVEQELNLLKNELIVYQKLLEDLGNFTINSQSIIRECYTVDGQDQLATNPKGKKIHSDHEKRSSTCAKVNGELKKMNNAFVEWFSGKGFKALNMELVKRDKAKKMYQHYNTKLNRMRDEKSRKQLAGQATETDKDKAKLTRNEDKFKKSYQEYEKVNKDTFEKMVKVLSNRFKIITPTIGKYLTNLQALYSGLALENALAPPPREVIEQPPPPRPQQGIPLDQENSVRLKEVIPNADISKSQEPKPSNDIVAEEPHVKFDYEGISSSDSEELKVDMDNPGQNFDLGGGGNDEDEFDFMSSEEEEKNAKPDTPIAQPNVDSPVPKANEQSMHIPEDLFAMSTSQPVEQKPMESPPQKQETNDIQLDGFDFGDIGEMGDINLDNLDLDALDPQESTPPKQQQFVPAPQIQAEITSPTKIPVDNSFARNPSGDPFAEMFDGSGGPQAPQMSQQPDPAFSQTPIPPMNSPPQYEVPAFQDPSRPQAMQYQQDQSNFMTTPPPQENPPPGSFNPFGDGQPS